MTTEMARVSTTDVVDRAERATLGAAMESRVAYERIAQLIVGADFADPRHELIWDAIRWVNDENVTEHPTRADATLVTLRLHELGKLAEVGGPQYLLSLVRDGVIAMNGPHYAREVARYALARRVATLGTQLHQAATSPESIPDLERFVASAMDQCYALLDGRRAASDETTPDVDEALGDMEAPDAPTVPTGLTDLDEALGGGMRPGELVVVAGRPATGKSILGVQALLAVARSGRTAVLYSLEMDRRRDLNPRLMANLAGVNLRAIREKKLTDADWAKLSAAAPEFASLPILWSDRPDRTPSVISQRIGALKRQHPDLGVVVVDYLQLVTPDSTKGNRQEDVASMTRSLKLAAKRHGVPIVLLAQLNRGSEKREGRRPELTDLRESGAIEQDADIVLLLHDPAPTSPDRAGEIDIIVAKQRNGEANLTIPVAAQRQYVRFADLARPSDRDRYC